MLVKCLHYSVEYPTGMQRIGDIFNLEKKQAEYYESIGWVSILSKEFQPKGRRGGNRINNNESLPAVDLSKSEKDGRYLKHIYKGVD